ncbi:MAG TPA: hypothetical protein VGS19_29240 [Streptosporangiaceae bacterium]|nr:hypothetical protein [Streptosporangiaceae bacterium]
MNNPTPPPDVDPDGFRTQQAPGRNGRAAAQPSPWLRLAWRLQGVTSDAWCLLSRVWDCGMGR